jgi:hypothetical protein
MVSGCLLGGFCLCALKLTNRANENQLLGNPVSPDFFEFALAL